MKVFRYLKPILAGLILTLSGGAQSRAYAKFDGNGEIIGLFNLGGSAECRNLQTIMGSIRNVKTEVRNTDIGVTFSLVSGSRRRIVGFSLKHDAIPQADIESLLINKGRFRVNAAACQNGSRWIADEITRL